MPGKPRKPAGRKRRPAKRPGTGKRGARKPGQETRPAPGARVSSPVRHGLGLVLLHRGRPESPGLVARELDQKAEYLVREHGLRRPTALARAVREELGAPVAQAFSRYIKEAGEQASLEDFLTRVAAGRIRA